MVTGIASATSAAAAAQENAARATLSGSFDTFLTLLTAQLSNQDPLNPVDSAQFTQQLVQYSQVEQQIETNSRLATLLAQSQTAGAAAAVGYIGNTAVFDSDVAGLHDGEARWTWAAPGATGEVAISVLDSSGREVFRTTAQAEAGARDFVWNGENDSGRDMPDGPYRLAITARDGAGDPVTAAISVSETVSGIDFSTGSPTVLTAAGARTFDSIRTIRQ